MFHGPIPMNHHLFVSFLTPKRKCESEEVKKLGLWVRRAYCESESAIHSATESRKRNGHKSEFTSVGSVRVVEKLICGDDDIDIEHQTIKFAATSQLEIHTIYFEILLRIVRRISSSA